MIKYIGFGYNCDITEILTRGGIRQESLPFDWTYSFPDEIEESLLVDFEDWLDPQYLTIVRNSTSRKIVTSHALYNSHEKVMHLDGEDRRVVFFNHHNLLDPVDRDKVQRRIDRYRNIVNSDDHMVFITNASRVSIKAVELDKFYQDRGNYSFVYLEHGGYGADAVNLSKIDNDIVITYISDERYGNGISKMICAELTNIFGGSEDNTLNPSITIPSKNTSFDMR